MIWDSTLNQPIIEVPAPGEVLETLWSSDGDALISRDRSGEVYWWDMATLHNKKKGFANQRSPKNPSTSTVIRRGKSPLALGPHDRFQLARFAR